MSSKDTVKTGTGSSKKEKTSSQMLSSPRRPLEDNDQLDISIIDRMGMDEFLTILKNKAELHPKNLWNASCALALQLKASRELLSIGSNELPYDIKLIDRLVDSAYIVLNTERVYLLEIDTSTDSLKVTHTREEDAMDRRIPLSKSLEGEVYSSRSSANIENWTEDTEWKSYLESKSSSKTKTGVCVPVIHEGRIYGVLEAINKTFIGKVANGQEEDLDITAFTPNDVMMLKFIASNIAKAISTECGEAHCSSFVSPLSMEDESKFHELIDNAYSKLDAERVSVFTYNPLNQTLICTTSQDIQGVAVPLDKGIVGCSFTSLRVINVTDVDGDERHNKEVDSKAGFITKSVLSAPILDQTGIAIGVIQAINKKNGSNFTNVDEQELIKICKNLSYIYKEQMTWKKIATGAPISDGNSIIADIAHPIFDGATLARTVANMMLSCSLEELVWEVEKASKSLAQCDFAGLYAVEKDCLIRIKGVSPAVISRGLTKAYSTTSGHVHVAVEERLDSTKMRDVPVQLKQAIQSNQIVEFRKPAFVGGDACYFLPTLTVNSAMIVPIQAKVHVCNPGTCVLIIASTTKLLEIGPSTKDIIEVFSDFLSKALNKLTEKRLYDDAIKSLKNNFYLVNNTLAALKDFVILLGSDGKLVACNKILEDLLGKEDDPAGLFDNTHFSTWLTPDKCSDLCSDIVAALRTGQGFTKERVTFVSPRFPKGATIDYQITPIENPDSQLKFNKTLSQNGVAFGTDGGRAIAYAVVIVLQLLEDHRSPTSSSRSVLGEVARARQLDISSAHGVVEAATSIIDQVRNSFEIDEETQKTLKAISASLSDTSRRLSISNVNMSAINVAIQTTDCPLVNPSVTLPDNIYEWEFNVLNISDGVILCSVIGKFFETLFDLETISVDKSTLARYIMEVAKNYHDRPFHNLQHSTCVTHFTFMLLRAADALNNIKAHQVFGILVSALVHDVDHPGNTNLFEINSSSELAIRYNDQSVLENHHCSTAFRLMRKPHTQILTNMSKTVMQEVRRTIISCVMATDMAVHFELIDETKKRASEGWNFTESKDQSLLGKILLHAADLSNPVRPFHMTRQWAERISIEFNDQVAREQALLMPVLGFMMTPDEKAFCKNETGFASFVVAPMWRSIAMLYPSLNFLVEQLDSNLATWKSLLEKIQAKEQAAAREAAEKAVEESDPATVEGKG